MSLNPDILHKARVKAEQRLLNLMNGNGHWEGQLSSSALAAAVACAALYQVDPSAHQEQLTRGFDWLGAVQNDDGGWGDTPESKSNLSTTMLVWSAFAPFSEHYSSVMKKAEAWIITYTGSIDAIPLTKSILKIYGNDKTFSAPILAMCALSGRLGPDPECWKLVPQLPLEAAILPQSVFKFMQLPVVSYAIPALIAIGLLRHRRGRSTPILGILRDTITGRLLDTLIYLQPENGGFLEATPLTAFVTLALAGAGVKNHFVIDNAVTFLLDSQRDDGSWPIDTDLATWISTLSIKVLEEDRSTLTIEQKSQLRQWLLDQQHSTLHPFTDTAPGGWAWTHWPGAVPDADDTAGALLALKYIGNDNIEDCEAAKRGITWLLDIQNRDGGIPTFCKGWGTLPFDRSCADLSGHVLRAFLTWQDKMDAKLKKQMNKSIERLISYILQQQHIDGYWLPLWFGNQWADNKANPLYGTVQVIFGLQHRRLNNDTKVQSALKKSYTYLKSQQNDDGGWGAHYKVNSSIEETALAISALASDASGECLEKGAAWLLNANNNKILASSPIGLYFASLWYDDKAYPAVFTAQALRRLHFSVEQDKSLLI
ncbi:squalene--hopene cyclase [bacterium]|nr:squalene--hopene cyclase [bacterium]